VSHPHLSHCSFLFLYIDIRVFDPAIEIFDMRVLDTVLAEGGGLASGTSADIFNQSSVDSYQGVHWEQMGYVEIRYALVGGWRMELE
jgi:hypothetical protein